jgi:hypothetical protein
MLNGLREPECGELVAQLGEARRKLAQPADLVALERQLALQEVLETSGQRRDPQVGTPCAR